MNIKFLLNILFFIFTCIHFYIVHKYAIPYGQMVILPQKIIYISALITAFIFLVIFYQLICISLRAFLNKNQKIIDFTKHTLFYFLLNMLFFIITKPFSLSFHDCYYIIPLIDKYEISWFHNLIPNMLFLISKNIIPSVFSVSIVCSFIYSLIFSYCVINLKEKYGKLSYFAVIFFCIPAILIFSLVQYSQIFVSYILCFLIFYIFFNENKYENKPLQAALLGFISAIIIFMRIENISFLIILPLLFYFMKIFNLKTFIVYCLSIILLFSPLFIIQKHHLHLSYELHNLSYILDYYKQNNLQLPEYEKFENVLSLNSSACLYLDNNCSKDTQELQKQAAKLMLIMTFKHLPDIIKYNAGKINEQLRFDDFILLKMQNHHFNHEDIYWLKNIKYLNLKNKIISLCVYGNSEFNNNIISKVIYNPVNYLVLLLPCLLYGILRRKKFFILSPMFIMVILFQILVLMPVWQFFYFYPVILLTPLISVSALLSMIRDYVSQQK